MNLLEKVEHELLVLENQSEKIEDHSELGKGDDPAP